MLAAEFPNDNPDLHEGTIWVCLQVTGAPVAERVLRPAPAPIIVEEPPPARESGIFMTFSSLADEAELDEDDEILVEELGPLEDAILEQVVAEAAPMTEPTRASEPVAVIASPTPLIELMALVEPMAVVDKPITPPVPDDPYVTFVSMLVEIASAHGAAAAAGELPTTLEGDPTAQAWAGILRGTSEDWDAVGGSMLDEWAADTLARVTGADAQLLKRDLRARGIAAFGLAA